MNIGELCLVYEKERKQKVESMNHLLDFYQRKYIAGEIEGTDYRRVFESLHQQGAVSAHEYEYV